MDDPIDFDAYEASQRVRLPIEHHEMIPDAFWCGIEDKILIQAYVKPVTVMVEFDLIDGSGPATSNRRSYERLKALELYNRFRLESAKIFEREKVAAYWKEKIEYFKDELKSHPENVQSLTEIIEACEGHYDIHA